MNVWNDRGCSTRYDESGCGLGTINHLPSYPDHTSSLFTLHSSVRPPLSLSSPHPPLHLNRAVTFVFSSTLDATQTMRALEKAKGKADVQSPRAGGTTTGATPPPTPAGAAGEKKYYILLSSLSSTEGTYSDTFISNFMITWAPSRAIRREYTQNIGPEPPNQLTVIRSYTQVEYQNVKILTKSIELATTP